MAHVSTARKVDIDDSRCCLLWPDTTPLVVKHALVGDGAFEALSVETRIPLEELHAIGTTAEMDLVPACVHGHGRLDRLFGQTRRAYDQVLRSLEVFRRIGDEQVGASLATEAILLAVVTRSRRLLFADPQPHQRTAARGANERPH